MGFAIVAGIAAFLFGMGFGGLLGGIILAVIVGGFFWFVATTEQKGQKSISPASSAPVPPDPTSDGLSTPNSGSFVLRGGNNEVISPAQFGYWSVRWSIDNTSGTEEEISNQSNTHPRFSKCIVENEFIARLQFMALYTAAYWAYAVLILGVPITVVKQMEVGLGDAIKGLTTPKGEPYRKEFVDLFSASFSRYYEAMQTDIRSDSDPNVYNPHVNELAKCAVTMFSKLFPQLNKTGTDQLADAQFEVELMSFRHLVADIPIDLFRALKEVLRLEFETEELGVRP